VGPILFKSKDAPTYAPGFIVVLATSTAAALLAIAYRSVCVQENCHRKRKDAQECRDRPLHDVGDRTKAYFRYVV
jgi:hypothetical protein